MDTHLIGIGGIGMSALAHLILDDPQRSGILSGSDCSMSPIVEQLRARGARIDQGLSALPADSASCRVVISSAIPPDHPERLDAAARGFPILHRSELLAELMSGQEPLLVTGTHGKTTTSALLAWVLLIAGWSPSLALGGCLKSHPLCSVRHGHRGTGLYFVAEADESDGSFLRYRQGRAILTNCDRDHLDHFGCEQALQKAFRTFAQQQKPEGVLWCMDDEALRSLDLPGLSYGESSQADWRCCQIDQGPEGLTWNVVSHHRCLERLRLPLWGHHNALNATAVVAMACQLGVPEDSIRQALATFPGVMRRCQVECEYPSVVIHDYGHHPTECAATLGGLRKRYPGRRLLAAFQPHRFSRTRDLMHAFGPGFREADLVVSTDVYAASEEPIPGVDGPALAAAMQCSLESEREAPSIQFVPLHELSQTLQNLLQPDDVLVCFGAGDIDRIAGQIAREISSYPHL